MDETTTAMGWVLSLGLALAERDLVPLTLVRRGIRHLLRKRLRAEADHASAKARVPALEDGPIAPASPPEERTPEVPGAFFEQVLGAHVQLSSGYWSDDISTLDDAEAAMLSLTCDRAGLVDGQHVLDLGCGWGALSIWMARRFPESRFVAVTDSLHQRAFIEARRPANLEVVLSGIGDFSTEQRFDRILSVEAFERLANWKLLLRRIASWLDPDGALLLQMSCHAQGIAPFAGDGPHGWLERYFSSRVTMSSGGSLERAAGPLSVETRWTMSGEHYARTAEAWRVNLEARRERVLPILRDCYGPSSAVRWYLRWRLLFLLWAESFGYRGGTEWQVAHYRLRPS